MFFRDVSAACCEPAPTAAAFLIILREEALALNYDTIEFSFSEICELLNLGTPSALGVTSALLALPTALGFLFDS